MIAIDFDGVLHKYTGFVSVVSIVEHVMENSVTRVDEENLVIS